MFRKYKPLHTPTYKEILKFLFIMFSFLIIIFIFFTYTTTIGQRNGLQKFSAFVLLGGRRFIIINMIYIPGVLWERLYHSRYNLKEYIKDIGFIVIIISISYGLLYSLLSHLEYMTGYNTKSIVGKAMESIYYAFTISLTFGHPAIKPTHVLGYIISIGHQGTIIYIILILIGHRTQVKSISTSQPIENKKPSKRGKKQID